MKYLLIIALAVFGLTSCTSVPAGQKGVEVSWGGEINMKKVYNEGMHWGMGWLSDDMVLLYCREHTIVEKFECNDLNSMSTPVEISLDYQLDPAKVNKLHKYINDWETKLKKTLKSAAKEVIPTYAAVDLNIHKRNEAEEKLAHILENELPDFYLKFVRVQITDVDLPQSVAQLAEEQAKQLERNNLASKKEAEQTALAKAAVAQAKGEFEAAEYKAKAREVLSSPKMIELQRIENEKIMWEGFKQHGTSPYGENNWFGANAASVIKGLK